MVEVTSHIKCSMTPRVLRTYQLANGSLGVSKLIESRFSTLEEQDSEVSLQLSLLNRAVLPIQLGSYLIRPTNRKVHLSG